jgi:hypothetical protein
MIVRMGLDVEDRAVVLPTLTPRQAEAAELAARYQAVAGEPPSCAWIGRRLGISREAARDIMARVRDRQSLVSIRLSTRRG